MSALPRCLKHFNTFNWHNRPFRAQIAQFVNDPTSEWILTDASVLHILADAPLEEATATVTAVNAIVFADNGKVLLFTLLLN